MRQRLVPVLFSTLIASCSSDPWPFPAQPCCAQFNPAGVGETILAVVIFIPARPDQRLEFLGAEPIGDLEGATVELFVSPPVPQPDGTTLIGDRLDPLAGAVLETPHVVESGAEPYTIGIVTELTPTEPGRFVLSAVRLRYRINGGAEQVHEGIGTVVTVCADDPKPETCEEESG